MTPTVIAVLITGPGLDEPALSLHTTGEQADRAFLAAVDDVWLARFGYRLSPSLDPEGRAALGDLTDALAERLAAEGYRVAIGEREVEL